TINSIGVGRTQIQNILKRKAEVLEEFQVCAPDRKRAKRVTGNEDINTLVWEFFKDCRKRNAPVNGPLLQAKALQFAENLKLETFKASNGWLRSFLSRHNIVFGCMSGERADVDMGVVDYFKSKVPQLCSGFLPKDIFNMDETGLFYKDGSRKTFHVKGDDCAGGKRSKERLSVALCASLTGEKLKPLVLGRSKKPRCFSKVKDVNKLPVMYRSNKKAWMTAAIFEEWLLSVNKQMRRENRNILLFLDNAPSHPHLELSNVKLQFFPANTTSKPQPMDQGIIETFKKHYRKRQLEHVIMQMEKDTTSTNTEILKCLDILTVIYWISNSWKSVLDTTITKCFRRCGFQLDKAESESDEDDEFNLPLSLLRLSKQVFDTDFVSLPTIDCDLATCDVNVGEIDWTKSANDLLAEEIGERNYDHESDDEEELKEIESEKCINMDTALSYCDQIKTLAEREGNFELLDAIMSARDITSKLIVKKCAKQPKINEFFVV
ncbi:tigger transposable element-derived protein 4, partial [Patella vulgata]|uniref:tigger transposable element-derived protein 4 n=1 Tax=Patella vulgata TaxID=6465 RepID=UPI0024A83086